MLGGWVPSHVPETGPSDRTMGLAPLRSRRPRPGSGASRVLVLDRTRWTARLAATVTEGGSQPRRIAELCVEGLAVSGAGVSLLTAAGNHGVVCATDEVATRIEDLQLTLGEGPCVDAVRTGVPVLVADLGAPENVAVGRWPAFMQAVTEAGVRAVFAFPLSIGAIRVGALDLYRDFPGDLNDDQLGAALIATDALALSLLRLSAGSEEAFDADAGARSTYHLQVHQATGMVSVQLGVSIEEAFLRLRARAFAAGRSVTEVASDVVARRLRFSVEDE